jgi:hypothetical protein
MSMRFLTAVSLFKGYVGVELRAQNGRLYCMAVFQNPKAGDF